METNKVMRSGISSGGFLSFAEIHAKPSRFPFSTSGRLQFFESAGFESRIYAFENDLPYSYSVPFFSGSGCRYYFNLHWKPYFKKNVQRSNNPFMINDLFDSLRFSLKWSQTIISRPSGNVSGETPAAVSPFELKFQLMADF